MSDPMADHLHAHDDEHDEDGWEDGEPMPHILWGRVGIFAAVVIMAFLVGRMSAGEGVSPLELRRAETRAATLSTQNEDLKTQIALLESGTAPIEEGEGADATGETEEGSGADQDAAGSANQPADKVQGLTYKVRKGDNLSRIASKFYGDGSLGSFIAEANGITDPASIAVGQKIVIPDRPKGN